MERSIIENGKKDEIMAPTRYTNTKCRRHGLGWSYAAPPTHPLVCATHFFISILLFFCFIVVYYYNEAIITYREVDNNFLKLEAFFPYIKHIQAKLSVDI